MVPLVQGLPVQHLVRPPGVVGELKLVRNRLQLAGGFSRGRVLPQRRSVWRLLKVKRGAGCSAGP